MNSQANPATPGKTDIEIQKEEDNKRTKRMAIPQLLKYVIKV